MIRTCKIKRMQNMKHILSKSLLIVLLTSLCYGCAEELDLASEGRAGFDEGELTECKLNITVDDYAVSSETRKADPDEKADNTASDQEKAIDNIWVFQYDASGNILIKPRYYTAASKNKEGSWPVLLKMGVESYIYVVANTNDPTWASSPEKFKTLDLLKNSTLPNPDVINPTETTTFYIPMMGKYKGENTNGEAALIEATAYSNINVAVERMYAKLVISTNMPTTGDDGNTITLRSIMLSNIPATCRVESQSCDDKTGDESVAGTYSGNFDVWSVEATNTTNFETTTEGTVSKLKGIVLYIPENIQGEVDGADKTTSKNIPRRALTVNYDYKVYFKNDPYHPDKAVDGYTESSVNVYPGCNTTNNFNVKRNRIYKITATISTITYFASTPSANCFIVEPGETLIFCPYYRTETGGRDYNVTGGLYNIRTYLDPTDEDLTIKSVKIIWQDENVIGDNSNSDKITLFSDYTPSTDDENTEYNTDPYEYYKKRVRIRVKTTGTEGNALIGGYNANGDIIWSWHIWVTDNDPANVGNARHFTTYQWNKDSIWVNSPRIEGYRIMPCNLGAKEFSANSESEARLSTFGPLYQWGRKDPFPTMKSNGYKVSGFCPYDNNNAEKHSNIHVYDNSNSLITMTGNGGLDTPTGELFRTVKCTDTASESSTTDEQRKAGLKYSINHPTVFISATAADFDTSDEYKKKSSYLNNGDWLMGHDDGLWGGEEPDPTSQKYRKVVNEYFYYYTAADRDISDIEPWMWDNYGTEKTIFDPSPKGWRVPPQDFWIGFTKNGESINQKAIGSFAKFQEYVNCDESIDTESHINARWALNLYISDWKTGETTYLPCQGTRLASGQPFNLNICGNYHCASVAYKYDQMATGGYIDNGRVNCFHVHSMSGGNQVNPFEQQRLYVCKALAGPIRCVLDTK